MAFVIGNKREVLFADCTDINDITVIFYWNPENLIGL